MGQSWPAGFVPWRKNIIHSFMHCTVFVPYGSFQIMPTSLLVLQVTHCLPLAPVTPVFAMTALPTGLKAHSGAPSRWLLPLSGPSASVTLSLEIPYDLQQHCTTWIVVWRKGEEKKWGRKKWGGEKTRKKRERRRRKRWILALVSCHVTDSAHKYAVMWLTLHMYLSMSWPW